MIKKCLDQDYKRSEIVSVAVDSPILNNPSEEPKEYWIYDEGQPKNMSGRRKKRYIIEMGI